MANAPSLSTVPHHVAIVMDGNGRWAKRRLMPRIAGHRQGVESLRRCIRACAKRGVGVLTVFAFSSENWGRPQDEVSGLMELMGKALVREVPELKEAGIRLHFVGDRQGLPERMRQSLTQAEAATADNRGMVLNAHVLFSAKASSNEFTLYSYTIRFYTQHLCNFSLFIKNIL